MTLALDQPVWSALTTSHAGFAEGGALARRYPAAMAPFGASRDDSPAALAALGALVPAGHPVALVTPEPLAAVPEGLSIVRSAPITQMVWAAGPATERGQGSAIPLTDADVPAMIALATRTRPGPFGPATHRFGGYVGIFEGKRLVAMAGERMQFGRYVEISAVCVDPPRRGRGYAQAVVMATVHAVLQRQAIPMLHVIADNAPAIALYQRLGFVLRRVLHLTRLARGD